MKYLKIVPSILAFFSLTGFVGSQTAITQTGKELAPRALTSEAVPPRCLGSFSTHEEAEIFLRTAKIIKNASISKGMTLPQKVTLEKDGRQEFGIFKSIDIRKPGITSLASGPEMDFKDSWKFEVGAYELDKLLGLHMIPPTIKRYYRNKEGSLQLWINGCITEEQRLQKKMAPPNLTSWEEQVMKLRVFDNLIYNIDRNQGNILISGDWSMILIDHSRAFKSVDDLPGANQLNRFSALLVDALVKLEGKSIKERAGKYITEREISAMLNRRDKILTLYRLALDQPGAVYP